jgi:hypothetical protein
VIGILPQTFTGTMTVFSPEVWVPLSAYESIANNFATEKNKPLASREGEHLMLIATFQTGHERDRSGTGTKNIGRKSGASVSGRTKRSDFTTRPVSRFSISDDPPMTVTWPQLHHC